MAISLTELIYDIYSTLEGTGRISDDSTIDTEHIKFKIGNLRSKLIRQDQSKGRSISDNITQVLPCVPVIISSSSECCDVVSSCKIMRTESQLPKPIEVYQDDLIFRVSGVDVMSSDWDMIHINRVPWLNLNKWTGGTKWFLRNRYIYIIDPPMGIKQINITGVFESPEEASNFLCSTGTCFNPDDSYPISSHMVYDLKKLVIEDLIKQQFGPSDIEGDELNRLNPKNARN